ncbi:MAG: hypothetical protein IPL32_02945 [Chloracidobacterium sp.]|nr:hypothetical protein [Chloracidobacterium sp.]
MINKWKMTFIFLTGLMLHEVLVHIWLSVEGLLPLTTKLFFGLTITPELNLLLIAINSCVLLICAYLGFLHAWGQTKHIERHA